MRVSASINDGTPYFLGSDVVMDTIFDTTGNFFPGDGLGGSATFTAPTTGKYYLNMCVAAIGDELISGHALMEIVTTARTYTTEFYANVDTVNFYTMQFSVCADMSALDEATFNVMPIDFTGNFAVNGSADTTPQTWVSGFII